MNLFSLILAGLLILPFSSANATTSDSLVECQLSDGRQLVAKEWMVIVGHEILAKAVPRTKLSTTAEFFTYRGPLFKTIVYKQFCGREGYMGVLIEHLTDERLPKGTVENLQCIQRNSCE